MANRYYIDGYNLLHKSPRLGGVARHDLEMAREGLIDELAQYCTATGHRVTVVFDGMGKQKTETVEHHRSVPKLEVRYAPSHLSADAVIERAVYIESNKMNVVVVTNDQGIRDLVRGMGALVMDPAHFWSGISETGKDLRSTLGRTQKNAPSFLEEQLDGESLARLRDLKDKL